MKTSDKWENGWLLSAQKLESPNFGLRPANQTIDLIVLHSISLPPAQFGGDEVLRFFTNSLDCSLHPYFEQLRDVQVSAHFFLRRDGQLWQLVSCDDRAWHAGTSCYKNRENCNDFSIGIELEGLEGLTFEPAQYERLAQLCESLRLQYPIQFIAGHEHIAPNRKFDPGFGFDWKALQNQLQWSDDSFPESVI